MRRFLSLLTMLIVCCIAASAQTRELNGEITDREGVAVPFALIRVKGTKIDTRTGVNGNYSIKVKEGDVLEISAAGFKTIETATGSLAIIKTILEKTGEFTEVVVTTAFGIKRMQRNISTNDQYISGEQLNTIRQPNINNALAGKAAGMQVRSQPAAALGRETSIRLRGESGLGGGSVIYVVNGTILPDANDINTDDIDNITVLRGPAASALFGSAAQYGAIVIDLKRAKKNQQGLGIEFNTGVQFDKVYSLAKYQNIYSGGSADGNGLNQYTWQDGQPEAWKALNGKYYYDYDANESWGPRMTGQEYIPWYAWFPGHEASFKTALLIPQPTNITDFYNAAVTFNNNISLSKVTNNASVRFSYGNLTQQGLLPGTELKRNISSVVSSFNISSKLSVGVNFTFLAQDAKGFFDDGYGGNTASLFSSSFSRDLDMNIMKDLRTLTSPTGQLVSWDHAGPTGYSPGNYLQAVNWFNPFSYLDNVQQQNRKDRLYGDVSVTYKFSNHLVFRGAYRKQQNTIVSDYRYNNLLEISASDAHNDNAYNTFNPGNKNTYRTTQMYYNRDVWEAILSYSKKTKNFTFNANAGIEVSNSVNKYYAANTNGGLIIPDLFALNNSKDDTTTIESVVKQDGKASFVRGDLGYKNYLFGEFALREDRSSTLPATRKYALVKSFGVSIVFSELTGSTISWLSFGKLRTSWAQTPVLVNSHNAYTYPGYNYVLAANNFTTNALLTTPNDVVDSITSSSQNTLKEIGIDLRFIKNRIGLSVTWYNEKQKGFPLATGFPGSYQLINTGEIDKKGVEIQFGIKPVWTRNFQWELNASWGKIINNKIVLILNDSIKQIVPLAQGYWGTGNNGKDVAYTVQEEGKEWGQVYGTAIATINGKRVIDTDPTSANYGRYITGQRKSFGSVLPDYTGGIQNTFTVFKNFVFNINIDYQVGGKFYSLSDYLMDNAGLSLRTAELNDKGIPVRDDVTAGGGVHVQGVDVNGKEVTGLYIKVPDYFKQNIVEDYVKDLTFVKLREFSLGYKIPVTQTKWGRWLQSATFSVVAKNPWLIYTKAKSFDPSEISNVQGEDAQFPAARGFGVNLKLGF